MPLSSIPAEISNNPILFFINFRIGKFLQVLFSVWFARQSLDVDTVQIIDIADTGEGALLWAMGSDSYSYNGNCYCFEIHSHEGLGETLVDTTEGMITVDEACLRAGVGPGPFGNPLYNDIQCGNGPPGPDDEINCPGRSEYGHEGCGHIGPKWSFNQE